MISLNRSFFVRTFGALGLVVAAAPLGAQQMQDMAAMHQPVPMVVTQGRGEASVTPDRATILFAVESRGGTAAEAGSRNARLQNAVLDTLRKLGFTPQQLGTLGYSVTPELVYPKEGGVPKVAGYVARNTIRVQANRVDQVGPAIDASLAKGATNVAGLRFESSQFDAIRRQALTDAVRNARADAEAMATAAGGSLGELIDLTNNDFGPQPLMEMAPMAMAKVAQAEPTPIVPGEQKVMVSVMARWKFQSGAARR